MINYRELQASDLSGMSSIDRSDYSSTWCEVEGGRIVLRRREFRHVGFSRAQWDRIAEEWKEMLARGDMLIFGAYDDPKMVGVAGLDTGTRYGPEGSLYNFGPIWISRKYRGRGIGRRLFEIVRSHAEKLDVGGFYISATPVPRTVSFYMGMGCRLLSSPDPLLYAEEPEDIHMCHDLSRGPHCTARDAGGGLSPGHG